MAKSKKLEGKVIKAMRENRLFRTEAFRLGKGFVGDYEVLNVRTFHTPQNEGDAIDNFTLECKSENRIANISGYQIANARVLSDKKIKADTIDGKEGVYKREDVADEIASSVPFHTKMEDGGFEFSDKLTVVGAFVNVDENNKPLIPMSRYKGYAAVLKHHQTEIGDPEAFMTREEFKGYLESDVEIKGVPATLKTLELAGSLKEDDEAAWSFTLMLADNEE